MYSASLGHATNTENLSYFITDNFPKQDYTVLFLTHPVAIMRNNLVIIL